VFRAAPAHGRSSVQAAVASPGTDDPRVADAIVRSEPAWQ
jgi:hypothetical protein